MQKIISSFGLLSYFHLYCIPLIPRAFLYLRIVLVYVHILSGASSSLLIQMKIRRRGSVFLTSRLDISSLFIFSVLFVILYQDHFIRHHPTLLFYTQSSLITPLYSHHLLIIVFFVHILASSSQNPHVRTICFSTTHHHNFHVLLSTQDT